MTGAAAWEKWLASDKMQAMLASKAGRYNSEAELLASFLAGIEAAEAIWRDPVVSAERLKQI